MAERTALANTHSGWREGEPTAEEDRPGITRIPLPLPPSHCVWTKGGFPRKGGGSASVGDVPQLAVVKTTSCLDVALVPAEQGASRPAAAPVRMRCPQAVATARGPISSPIMWGTRRPCNESLIRPRGSKGRRFLEAGEPEAM